jgi:subtilisin
MKTSADDFPPPQQVMAAPGEGVSVLVVDSGVEADHPAVAGGGVECWRVEEGRDGVPVVVWDDAGGDAFGHGTAVAGIIRQYAPAARLSSLKVFGGDLRASSRFILAGLQWAIGRSYDIVNCSFGSQNHSFLADYKSVVDQAFCRNVLLVSACNNADFRRAAYPACFPTVLSTDFGALDGLTLLRRPGQLVEFVARGESVPVAWKRGGYRVNTGSSFAAAHLAALAAKLRQLRPHWNACQVKSYLYATCRTLD